mmetsp:Transcript_41611/g.97739  ORF Transcript_41611/g.97739 Transcript_41611/m.97739 type:complete len:204 (-) Transcript_41611:9310-9921(-)
MAHHLLHAEGAGRLRVAAHLGQHRQVARGVHGRYEVVLPIHAPWVAPAIVALRGILPFPLMRQALAGPAAIGTGIFQTHPHHRSLQVLRGRLPARPVRQPVVPIRRPVARGLHEAREVLIGHRVLVDMKALDDHAVHMLAPRHRLPGVLHIQPRAVLALDLQAGHAEIVGRRGWHGHHAGRCGLHARRGLLMHQPLRQRLPLA